MLFILPKTNKATIQLMNKICSISDSVCIILFLLAHRAQINLSRMNEFTYEQIMQLPSSRWNAKQLANHPLVKHFYALESIVKTLLYEAASIHDFNEQQTSSYLKELANELVNNPKPRNAKILNANALKLQNISSHRYALMAQLTGHYQAIPIFDPKLLLSEGSLSTLTPDIFLT